MARRNPSVTGKASAGSSGKTFMRSRLSSHRRQYQRDQSQDGQNHELDGDSPPFPRIVRERRRHPSPGASHPQPPDQRPWQRSDRLGGVCVGVALSARQAQGASRTHAPVAPTSHPANGVTSAPVAPSGEVTRPSLRLQTRIHRAQARLRSPAGVQVRRRGLPPPLPAAGCADRRRRGRRWADQDQGLQRYKIWIYTIFAYYPHADASTHGYFLSPTGLALQFPEHTPSIDQVVVEDSTGHREQLFDGGVAKRVPDRQSLLL